MAELNDVAARVIDYFGAPGTDPVKLQKLAYFAQGWALALTGDALFDADFEARDNGPVVSALPTEPDQDTLLQRIDGDMDNLDDAEKIVVDAVLSNYGGLSGWELRELTHKPGTPWAQVWDPLNVGPDGQCHKIIDRRLIQQYFESELLGAVQAA